MQLFKGLSHFDSSFFVENCAIINVYKIKEQ